MTNKKNILIFFLLFCISFLITANDYTEKLKMPSRSKVLLVGKVSVTTDQNLEFLAKTRGITEEEMMNPNVYTTSITNSDGLIKISSKQNNVDIPVFTDGEFFFVKVDIPENRIINFSVFNYYFFSNDKAKLSLPGFFAVEVPKNVNYMYVGSFYYEFIGDDYTLQNAYIVDEYDFAQGELDRIAGKQQIQLYRANLKEIETKK